MVLPKEVLVGPMFSLLMLQKAVSSLISLKNENTRPPSLCQQCRTDLQGNSEGYVAISALNPKYRPEDELTATKFASVMFLWFPNSGNPLATEIS